MRLDKFLKLSRIIKRRVVAKELADAGAVQINHKKARPDSIVKVGDKIEIAFPRKIICYEVLEADEALLKKKAIPFSIAGETEIQPDQRPW